MAWAVPAPMTPGGERWSRWGRPLAAAAFVVALATAFYGVTIPEPPRASPTHPVTGRYVDLAVIPGTGFVPDGWHHAGEEEGSVNATSYVVSTDREAVAEVASEDTTGWSLWPEGPPNLRGDDAHIELIAIGGGISDGMPYFPRSVEPSELTRAGRYLGRPFLMTVGTFEGHSLAYVQAWIGPFAGAQTRRELETALERLRVDVVYD